MNVALKPEKTVAASPPAPSAPAIRQHRKNLMRALESLQASAPALALEASREQFGAHDALQNLIWKMKTLEYELSLFDQVLALAMAEDKAAEAAWRSAEDTMDVEAVTEGISKGGCCSRCTVGVHCVITAPDKNAGGSCGHPLLTRDQQFRDESGRRHFRYEGTPRALELYKTAAKKLGMSL